MATTAKAVVCLCLLFACQIRGFHIPKEMNKTIQNLLQHYNISRRELFNGQPVFHRQQLDGKPQEKILLMSGILDTYEKLLSHMIKQLPTPSSQTAEDDNVQCSSAVTIAGSSQGSEVGGDVRRGLKCILKKVRQLKENHFLKQVQFLHRLQTVGHIQLDDRVVQTKALFQLPWVYEEASALADSIKTERRRRRRQAKARARPRV